MDDSRHPNCLWTTTAYIVQQRRGCELEIWRKTIIGEITNSKISENMIKMYVMQTCPDCEYVEKQVDGNPNFEVIDIGKHVRNLKEFLKLRDTNPAFDEAKAVDDLGIPCYVLEDGTVTLYSKDVGLEPRPQEEGATCSLDGRGC